MIVSLNLVVSNRVTQRDDLTLHCERRVPEEVPASEESRRNSHVLQTDYTNSLHLLHAEYTNTTPNHFMTFFSPFRAAYGYGSVCLSVSFQLKAKVRSVVKALGIPVEAYLACRDDYNRKVPVCTPLLLLLLWFVLTS